MGKRTRNFVAHRRGGDAKQMRGVPGIRRALSSEAAIGNKAVYSLGLNHSPETTIKAWRAVISSLAEGDFRKACVASKRQKIGALTPAATPLKPAKP